jgi:hypothetical protein
MPNYAAICKTVTVAISLHLRIWACHPFAPARKLLVRVWQQTAGIAKNEKVTYL